MENNTCFTVRTELSPLLVAVILCLPYCLWANMASPVSEGTLGSSPFTAKYASVNHESILIQPDAEFATAKFTVEYDITVHKSGVQVPLLFYAMEYHSDFQLWVDQQPVALQPVPSEYMSLEAGPLEGFSGTFEPGDTYSNNEPRVEITWNEHGGGTIARLSDFKYFEADLDSGQHTIRVEYVATVWEDRSSWVKEYSLRYALSPAQYWNSYGTLSITLDASQCDKTLTTNLGTPQQGVVDDISSWQFNSLPAPLLKVMHRPAVTPTASTLMAIGPGGMAWGVAVLLALLHLLLMWWYRKARPQKPVISWVMVTGAILVPLLAMGTYNYAFILIENVLGAAAGDFYGYNILIFMLYMPVVLAYLLAGTLIDWGMRKLRSA